MDPLATFNIVAIVVGFLLLFFGYRFYKPTLFLGGFTFAAMFTFELCLHLSHTAAYGAGAAAGIIGGTLSVYIYPLGVFVLGALWGTVLSLILNGFFISRIGYVVCQCNTILWIVMPFFAVLFGLFTIVVHRHRENDAAWHPRKLVIFSKTSWTGAYMLMRGIGHFTGNMPEEQDLAKMVSPVTSFYGMMGGVILLALLGTWIQMRYTHFEHCGCDDSEYQESLVEQAEQRQAFLSGTEIKNDQV